MTKNLACSSLLALSLAAMGQGAVLVDSFNGALNLNIPSGGANPSSISGGNSPGAANVVGGSRGVTFTRTAGNGAEQLNVDLGGTGYFEFASGSFDTVTAFLQWDGDTNPNSLNGTGLGGLDLTEGGLNDRLVIYQHADRPTNATNFGALTLTIYTGAGNRSSYTVNSINTAFIGPFLELEFPFAAFVATLGTGADFTDVGAIELFISGTSAPGLDMALDFIASRGVPEPTTLLLVGGALFGLGFMRRRRTV
jgi:hypothetical protein